MYTSSSGTDTASSVHPTAIDVATVPQCTALCAAMFAYDPSTTAAQNISSEPHSSIRRVGSEPRMCHVCTENRTNAAPASVAFVSRHTVGASSTIVVTSAVTG